MSIFKQIYNFKSYITKIYLWLKNKTANNRKEHIYLKVGLPWWLSGKASTCQCRRHKRCGFDPRVEKVPWRRAWQLTPVFLPGETHGLRSLVGYSPWGHKWLSTHTYLKIKYPFPSPSQASTVREPWTSRCSSYFKKQQRNQRSNCQHPLDYRKSKRIPEKHLFLLYWLCQSLWLCGSPQSVENPSRDGDTRPSDLPPETSVCRLGSNSQNWTWNNRLVPNRERSTSRLYIVTLLI